MALGPIQNLPDQNRFEIKVGEKAAVLTYRRMRDHITFLHTEVPEESSGGGIGAALARAGLEYARSEGLKVIPACPFIAKYIERHPEYRDLLR